MGCPACRLTSIFFILGCRVFTAIPIGTDAIHPSTSEKTNPTTFGAEVSVFDTVLL